MFGIDDAALATMLAGAISTAGSLYTNRKNRDAQQEANRVNLEIARQNNATQIEMANTAHEREVRDLRRAGLNPILSAGGNGASTPTLQAPSIDPVHTDNAFEGLANSAKGVGRYLSQQYKNELAAQTLSNDILSAQKEVANNDARISQREWLLYEDSVEDRHTQKALDLMQSRLEQQAFQSYYGIKPVYDDFGRLSGTYVDDWDKYKRALELTREGIQSDLKQRANRNWRANMSSFVPFTSPAAVNSASSAVRGFR